MKLSLNQWKNTTNAIEWFKNIQHKTQHKFVIFDIKDFYPSIKQNLLTKALIFAKLHTAITKTDYDIILHSRKSLLYSNDVPWIKKDSGTFDVTMGAFDGAEVCELVGLYLLSILTTKCNKDNIGLYRDDGLAVFKDISGPQSEKLKKQFQKMFNENGLKIEIKCNLKIFNYLDVTLNLNDGTYKPYRKPNDETLYVHAKSNHPPNIIKEVPIAIEKRLCNLSASKEIFEGAAMHYRQALAKCGYNHILSYHPPTANNL